MMASGYEILFAVTISAKCNYECPAVQDAIDRMASAVGCDRGRLLGNLHKGYGLDATGAKRLSMMLLEAWKPSDVLLATDLSQDEWLAIAQRCNGIEDGRVER
jgi:hypothetical protein